MKPQLTGLAIAFSLITAHGSFAQVHQLSGAWRGSDGGVYQIQQDGLKVWWHGSSADGGRTWRNLFSGALSGNLIEGSWAGQWTGNRALESGTLRIRMQDNQLIKVPGEGDGFGAEKWEPLGGVSTCPSTSPKALSITAVSTPVADLVEGRSRSDDAVQLPVVLRERALRLGLLLTSVLRALTDEASVNKLSAREKDLTDLQRVEFRLEALGRMFPQ